MPNIPTLLMQLREINLASSEADALLQTTDRLRERVNQLSLRIHLRAVNLELEIARAAIQEGDSRESV